MVIRFCHTPSWGGRMREGGEGSVGFQLHVQIHGVLNADCGLS